MKAFKNILLLATVFSIVGCSEKEQPGAAPLTAPEVRITSVKGDSFTASWSVVQDAGSYTYIFDEGPEVTTKDRSVEFSGLTPDNEYVLYVRADAGPNSESASSGWTEVHVVTGAEIVLSTPAVTVVSSFKSKTIIEWTKPAGAETFEYTFDGVTAETSLNRVEFNHLAASKEYVFSVKAQSPVSYVSDSEPATVRFVTESDDVDVPVFVFSTPKIDGNSVTFEIYAMSNIKYRYGVVPASSYSRDSVLASQSEGIGTTEVSLTELEFDTAYIVAAVGIDGEGNTMTETYTMNFKTGARQ
jgi:predicted small lipoprotein YifL